MKAAFGGRLRGEAAPGVCGAEPHVIIMTRKRLSCEPKASLIVIVIVIVLGSLEGWERGASAAPQD